MLRFTLIACLLHHYFNFSADSVIPSTARTHAAFSYRLRCLSFVSNNILNKVTEEPIFTEQQSNGKIKEKCAHNVASFDGNDLYEGSVWNY